MIDVAFGERAGEPEVRVPSIGSAARTNDLVRAALGNDVSRLVRTDAALRVGPNPSAVHDARVAVRRLRSHLRTFAPVLDAAWASDLHERLRWLSGVLGESRDADVVVERIAEEAANLRNVDRGRLDEVLQPLREDQAAARNRLSQALRDPRYLGLVDLLIAAANEPRVRSDARRAAAKVIPTLMKPVWRRFLEAAHRAHRGATDRALHRIRVRAKHLRYAAEVLEPVAGSKARRFARHFSAVQEQLGAQHDAVMASAALRKHLEAPQSAFLAGQIVTILEATAERWRAEWPEIERSACNKRLRFW